MHDSEIVRVVVQPRRGLSRVEAARYVGIGTTKFDEMVADRRMPQAFRIDGRVLWDIHDLDAALDNIKAGASANAWDNVA
jgi:predicted DNA-binding transcriptional regulator AlpA